MDILNKFEETKKGEPILKTLLTHEDLFFHRTYVCNAVMESIYVSEVLGNYDYKKYVDRIIRYKFNNVLNDKKYMIDYIVNMNLFFNDLKSSYFYAISMDFELEEYFKKREKLISSYCTPGIEIRKTTDNMNVFVLCRNEAELFMILKGIKDNDIKYKSLKVNSISKDYIPYVSNHILVSSLNSDNIEEILNKYNKNDLISILLNTTIEKTENEEEIFRLKIDKLFKNLMKYYLKDYDMKNKIYFARISSMVFKKSVEEYNSYLAYCIRFAYILLHRYDEKIRNFFQESSGDKEPEFLKEDIDTLLYLTKTKIKELIDKKEFGLLICIIDIIDTLYILEMKKRRKII